MPHPSSLSKSGKLLERGVHVANVLGPNGETILLAVDHRHRLTTWPPTLVEPGQDHLGASDNEWDTLDRNDPFYLEAI